MSYAAVGASRAEDLLKYPPHGSTPFEFEVQLGSGEERFLTAAATLMTWGGQLGAGVTVETVSTPEQAPYSSMTFSEGGVPQGQQSNEAFFAPDGTPYLEAGMVVKFVYDGKSPKDREFRVVSTIAEERRVGFVIGVTEATDIGGEEFFSVELRPDETVWAVVRGFLYDERSQAGKLASKNPIKIEMAAAKEQIVALTPAVQAAVKADLTEGNGGGVSRGDSLDEGDSDGDAGTVAE